MGIYHSLMYKLSNEESTYNTDDMYSSDNVYAIFWRQHTSHVILMLKGVYQCLMYIHSMLSTEDSTHDVTDAITDVYQYAIYWRQYTCNTN